MCLDGTNLLSRGADRAAACLLAGLQQTHVSSVWLSCEQAIDRNPHWSHRVCNVACKQVPYNVPTELNINVMQSCDWFVFYGVGSFLSRAHRRALEKQKQQIVLSSSMTIPFVFTVLYILFIEVIAFPRDLWDWIKYTWLHGIAPHGLLYGIDIAAHSRT